MDPTRIIFICMGNICRSPLAEAIFLHHCNLRSLTEHYEVASAGIGGWHAGDPADHRSRAVASRNGIDLITRAQQVTSDDFDRYDLFVCMDDENVRDLRDLGCPQEKITTLMQYHPESGHDHVPDPYYGGTEGFELVFKLVDQAVVEFLDHHHSPQ